MEYDIVDLALGLGLHIGFEFGIRALSLESVFGVEELFVFLFEGFDSFAVIFVQLFQLRLAFLVIRLLDLEGLEHGDFGLILLRGVDGEVG